MNEKKLSAKIIGSKTVKEYMQFAATAINDVLAPARMVDKVASAISDPAFFAASDQLEWLMKKIEAIFIEHVSQNVKDPLTKVTLGFNLAALANMEVQDLLPVNELQECVENGQ